MQTPRRNLIYFNTPVELSIRKAIMEIESLPPSEKLTNAVTHLNNALKQVSDFVDEWMPEKLTQ